MGFGGGDACQKTYFGEGGPSPKKLFEGCYETKIGNLRGGGHTICNK